MKFKLLLIAGAVFFAACSGGGNKSNPKAEQPKEEKVLIAYYSLSGNTAELAKQIQKEKGGDLFEIQMVNPYPNDENEMVKMFRETEDYKSNPLPELANKVENMDEYDVVFIGTPIWYSTAALPVFTFLKSYDFAGKTIIPFYTCGGGTGDPYEADVKELCPNSTVLPLFGTSRAERTEGIHIEKVDSILKNLKW